MSTAPHRPTGLDQPVTTPADDDPALVEFRRTLAKLGYRTERAVPRWERTLSAALDWCGARARDPRHRPGG